MTTADELIALVEPPELEIKFCTKPALILQRRALKERHDSADGDSGSLGRRSEKAVLADELAALDEKMNASMATIVARAVDAAEYAAMKARCPRADGKPGGFNPDTFSPVLLAACAVAPAFTEEQAKAFVARLSDGQRDQICGPLVVLNESQFDLPLDVGSYGGTQASG